MNEPDVRFAWIVFVDLIDSSAFADVLGVKDHYTRVLEPYHEAAAKIFEEMEQGCSELEIDGLDPLGHYRSIRGDEVIGVFPSASAISHSTLEERRRLMWFAFRLGIRLKASWLTGAFNTERIKDQRSQIDVAIGVHCGPLVWKTETDLEGRVVEVQSPEGFALSYTKRIESASRQVGDSHFALSPEAANEGISLGLPRSILHRVDLSSLKGLSGTSHAFAFGGQPIPPGAVTVPFEDYGEPVGFTYRTMISNAITGWNAPPRHHPIPSQPNEEPEGAKNPLVREAVFARLPLLRPAVDLVSNDQSKQDFGERPNAISIAELKDRFYSTPEPMRLAYCLDACYALDKNGDSHTEITRPFDWLRESYGNRAPYRASYLRNLLSAGLSDRSATTSAAPHDLFCYPGPYIEAYQLARIVRRITSEVRDRDLLQKWEKQFLKYVHFTEPVGELAVNLVAAEIRARLKSKETKPLDVAEVRPVAVRKALGKNGLANLRELAKPLNGPDALTNAPDGYSRPVPTMCAFGAWAQELLGNRALANGLLQQALDEYELIYEREKAVVLGWPGWGFTEENFEEKSGYFHISVCNRHDIDWWTGELVRRYELIPRWIERLPKAMQKGYSA